MEISQGGGKDMVLYFCLICGNVFETVGHMIGESEKLSWKRKKIL